MNNEETQKYYTSLTKKSKEIGSENITLAEHAEMWWVETGHNIIPDRNTADWNYLYRLWFDYAFSTTHYKEIRCIR